MLTFTTSSVNAGTYYTFWVAARNFIDTGDLSPPVVQLAASVPDKPNAPTIDASYNTVSLTWSAPNNGGVTILDYEIYWDSDGNSSDDFSSLATTTDTFFSVTSGIVQGTTYKFRILARNSIGVSPQSDIGTDTAASEPAQPATPTKKSADTTAIVIEWTQPDDRGSPVINYEVFWDAGNGGDPRTALTTTNNSVFEASTTLVLADLIDGSTYRFAVRAVNAPGASLFSETLSVIAATVPGTPATPSIVSASSASLQIEWDEPSSGGTVITNYHVYEAEGENPASIDFVKVADTGLTRSYTKSILVTPG